MKKTKPLDDLEIHELLSLIYPEHIKSDDDEYFDLSQEIGETEIIMSDYGDSVTLSELLGRVVMLTMPMKSAICGKYSHCLGKIEVSGDSINMMAVVRRDAEVMK